MKVKYLVIGAGISGLSFAELLNNEEYLILEKTKDMGGYCKTIKRNGYIWDYAGHFFHFRNSEIENRFVERIGKDNFVKVKKNTKIFYKGIYIDYPFQKNIHQLNKEEFIECLYDLFHKGEKQEFDNFLDMLYGKFGIAIVEKFLRPYNEKLYACNLKLLDTEAMGRFFPYADIMEIIDNMKNIREGEGSNSYNDVFSYPKNGAIEFIKSIEIDKNRLRTGIQIEQIDIENKTVYTDSEKYEYEYLVSTIPMNTFLSYVNKNMQLSWNKVLVLNLGFDSKTNITDIHWIYVPDQSINFYRVGFYDNILNSQKGSLYVEIGFEKNAEIDVDWQLEKTIQGLRKMNIISDQRVVDWEPIIMDPAYVHITQTNEISSFQNECEKKEVYFIGRYGTWTYCSIEDCIISAENVKERIFQREKNEYFGGGK